MNSEGETGSFDERGRYIAEVERCRDVLITWDDERPDEVFPEV